MGEQSDEQTTLRQLVLAAQTAFGVLWPAFATGRTKLSEEQRFEAVVASLVLSLCERYAIRAGLPAEPVRSSKLATLAAPVSRLPPLEALAYRRAYDAALVAAWGTTDDPRLPSSRVSDIGAVYESLLALASQTRVASAARGRKPTGSYYTPAAIASEICEAALLAHLRRTAQPVLELLVLDPAVGAGAFLIQACRVLADELSQQRRGELSASEARAEVVAACLYGVDVNPLSVAVTEVCLWLLVGDARIETSSLTKRLRHGDALIGVDLDAAGESEQRTRIAELQALGFAANALDWRRAFPEVERGFDVVVGNPPWVAYAGRSAQALPAPLRKYYSEVFLAWKGFPTLHGLFVERAAKLSPRGTLALLLPSPVADLGGYRNVRSVLTRTHHVAAPLTEFGQDAFVGVTQPCFALVAEPSPRPESTPAPWRLSERQRSSGAAEPVEVPPVLRLMLEAPRLAPRHFGEMGFQTSRVATETLLLRAEAPDVGHPVALLEGKNVQEFSQRPPRLFLCDDPARLKHAKCRLRPASDYQRVDFVVRQTAQVPIAALHNGLAFRNSLLAGFGAPELPASVLVALLNSSLYRALHLAGQRDARQAAFPQVKIGHLRALPQPPADPSVWRALEALSRVMTEEGVSPERRIALDTLVFGLFAVPEDHQRAVLAFLQARAPRYTPPGMFTPVAPTSSLDTVRRALGGRA